MSNNYIFVSLLCIIILNCFLIMRYSGKQQREGFNWDKLNPAKLIEESAGDIIDLMLMHLGLLLDQLLGSVPILKEIHKKVKKKVGLFTKIKTTFFEMFVSLMRLIFNPLAAILVLYLAYQLFLVIIANSHLLFQPNSLLKYIC